MSKIELTEAEIKFIKWHNKAERELASIGATFCYTPETAEEMEIASSVLNKAIALEDELKAYDETAENLLAWFWEKYQLQKAEERVLSKRSTKGK